MKNELRTYDFNSNRIVCWFSCGATSAMAAYLAMRDFPRENVHIVYCDTGSEHESSKKFLLDFQRKTNCKIEILKSEKYKDIWEVFEKTGWLVGPEGARCTMELKKSLRQKYEDFNDIQIFGYDRDEKDRAEKFMSANPEVKLYCPLIERGLSSADAKGWIQDMGMELPEMYKLGYGHNNCIGCVKGQMGYWNKIRVDFPNTFDRMAKVERKIGAAICKSYAGDGERKPVYLDELDPEHGRYDEEPAMVCDMLCQIEMGDNK